MRTMKGKIYRENEEKKKKVVSRVLRALNGVWNIYIDRNIIKKKKIKEIFAGGTTGRASGRVRVK